MARDVVLYITASLDGFIADANGSVDWLIEPGDEDFGFLELMDSVDTVLQGSHTYLSTLDLVDEDPYGGKTDYVFTSRDDLPVLGDPIFVKEDPVEFVRRLKAEPGERMWLIGGGELASTLLDAGLVDEIDLFIQPVVLGDGIPLWRQPMQMHRLELLEAKTWSAGLPELRYRVPSEA